MGLPNDIARCRDRQCRKRSECIRYLDKPTDLTFLFIGTPRDAKGCRLFIQATDAEKEQLRREGE